MTARGLPRAARALPGAAAFVVVGAAAAFGLAGCKTRESLEHGPRDGSAWSWVTGGGAGGGADGDALVASADAGAAARVCLAVGGRVAIPGGALVVGDGVLDGAGAGATFGLLRSNGAAAWAHLDHPGGALSIHDLPPSDPDAPPPAVVRGGADPGARFLLYSQSEAPRADAGRPLLGTMAHADAGGLSLTLVVARLEAGTVETVARIPEPRDDSLDADIAFSSQPGAGGLVAWDDDEPFGRFGRIRAAHLDAAGHLVGEPVVLTPEGTDAESPRIVATRAGFVVVYRVRRGEVRDAGLVEDAVEAPGERRAYHWLEAIAVRGSGPASAAAPTSAAVPALLTSATAHVGAFVVAADANPDDSIDVIARDDDAPRDAAGGQLLALHLAPNLGTPAVGTVLVPGGVGAGALSLVALPSARAGDSAPRFAPFIVFSSEDDSARRVSLAGGTVHLEPALDGADPVVLVPGPAPGPGAPDGLPGGASLVVLAPDVRDGAPARSESRRAATLATLSCP